MSGGFWCAFVRPWITAALFTVAFLAHGARPIGAAEPLRIGIVKTAIGAPVYVAVAKGFFEEEGLTPEIVFFDAAQPVSVAVVSGDVDVGVTGFTGGFYTFASQGAVRIIAAHSREVPGFHGLGFFVSNRAWDAGLRSMKDLAGRNVAINTVGSAYHYCLGLAAEKYGFDLKSVRISPLQTNPNEVSALTGGTADAVILPGNYVATALAHGQARVLGWVGEETPFQLGAAFVSPRTADTRRDFVERFLRGYRKGARFYHDALTGPDERRQDGPSAPEVFAIIAKTLGQAPEDVSASVAYADPDERIDVKDVAHQIEWYRAQGMLKGSIDFAALMDRRYIIPLTE